MSTIHKHLAKPLDWREAACGHVMTPSDSLPTTNNFNVTCPACKQIVDDRRASAEFDKAFIKSGLTTSDTIHMSAKGDTLRTLCGTTLVKYVSPLPAVDELYVNCPACIGLLSKQAEEQGQAERAVTPIEDWESYRRDWAVAVVGGLTELGFNGWLKEQGVGTPTPKKLHKPPRMEDSRGMVDGVFEFYDVHVDGCSMEVVPQLSGNVEITVSYGAEDGYLFTLSLFDRANLLSALLHEFHYGPEIGGPADDQD